MTMTKHRPELWEATAVQLLTALREAGWTLPEIATEIGRDKHSVSRWANGHREPDEDVYRALRGLAKKFLDWG